MKNIAVVQCTYFDLYSNTLLEDDYVINKLKKSKLFDKIIICSPKIGNYEELEKIAKNWNIECYIGSDYNVLERILEATKSYSPDIITRVLLRAFYIDINTVRLMIDKLKEGYDYIDLDLDYNYALAADVTPFSTMEKVKNEIELIKDDFKRNSYFFAPWEYIRQNKKYNTFLYCSEKLWSPIDVKNTKEKIDSLLQEENKSGNMAGAPSGRYQFVKKYLDDDSIVLDIACGQGEGSFLMSKSVSQLIGVDYDKNYIENAKDKYNDIKNLEYIQGTIDELSPHYINSFTHIVSLHTLEHVDNDIEFLKIVLKLLKDNGTFILEVPRHFRYPLDEPLFPFHDKEYDKDELLKTLLSLGFKVKEAYGVNRNTYTNIEDSREAFMYILEKEIY